MNISFEVEGVKETVAAFDKVEKGITDLRQGATWMRVRQAFYRIQKEIFASEGGASGAGKWQALSPAYAVVKLKKYGNKPILQATGAMYKEFTSTAGKTQEQAQSLTFTFNSPAGYHMNRGGKMPYRTALELTDGQKEELLEPIKLRLRQLADNAKLLSLR